MDNIDVEHPHTNGIELPAPTAWPLVLALGLTFAFLGMVTSFGVSVLGGVLILAGSVGWFRQVLPHPRHEFVPVKEEEIELTRSRPAVARVRVDKSHRARVPVETPSMIAGIKGGIAGGAAMILPALLFGQIRFHSIWYAVNLLGGAGVANWIHPTMYQLTHFRLSALIAATIIHVVTSLLVGLLYGAMLPVLPRHPVILGGLLAPILWTGLLHSSIGLINPFLAEQIKWGWFVVSQLAFGLVAGWVVAKQTNIHTAQYLPFAARAGLETPGLMSERTSESGEDKA
jgi:hypothetical protein